MSYIFSVYHIILRVSFEYHPNPIGFFAIQANNIIGRSIVEKQNRSDKAEYGIRLIQQLSEKMTADFGKGFTVANLKNMSRFYLTFPNGYALRSELSWTHYRLLMRVENKDAWLFYTEEATKSQ
ncbi:MAG: hypothetical protein IKE06_00050 [Solobacterium sp.]|nr:hypothetical protein [Solobacterium sp.]MBR3126904.1 hypothetical protein [Solobacterium sp.]